MLYFHIQQCDRLIQKSDGVEVLNLDASWVKAMKDSRHILAEAVRCGEGDLLDDAVVITNGAGQELKPIPFTKALPPRLPRA